MYTLDEIIHLTGIPENKAIEVCRMLCSEGYLIFNEKTGKYSLTNDSQLLERIRNVGQQMSNEYTARQTCGKIQDIMTLGKPLALSEKGLGLSVPDIGVPGLNVIFSAFERKREPGPQDFELKKTPGLPRGHCILIKGEPGTGKTTIGMQIALYLEKENYRSLFLTFEENIKQLCSNLDVYCRKDVSQGKFDASPPLKNKPGDLGWDKALIKKVTRSITKIQTPTAWEDPEAVIQELCAVLDKEMPQLVVIDSISRFRDIGGETKARLVLRRLIRILKIRNITSIFLGEDRGESNAFEEYETDGIIHLKWLRDQLSLSVTKMRGLRAYKGPHSAAMLALADFSEEKPEHHFISEMYYLDQPKIPHLKVGFNVFPEISVYNDVSAEQKHPKSNSDEKSAIYTGTTGLDDLLPLGLHYKPTKGFKKGEMVLIIGSAGSGKTLMALNFILDGYRKERKEEYREQEKRETEKEEKKRKLAVWINLEGDIGTLKFAADGFEGRYKIDLDMMINPTEYKKGEKEGDQEYFKFFSFPPINLDLNKIVYTLEAIHRSKKYTIDRLVIDSITELERAKGGGQPEVKSFLAGLIQFLRDRNITTIFISRSDTFFRRANLIPGGPNHLYQKF
jgi:KaiC/GvpD/RAD55 family RecA-like ATPase